MSFPAPRNGGGSFFMTQDTLKSSNIIKISNDDDYEYEKQHTPVKRDSSKIDRNSPNSPSPKSKYGRSTIDDIFNDSSIKIDNSNDYDFVPTKKSAHSTRKVITTTKVIKTKCPSPTYYNNNNNNTHENNNSYNTRSNSKLNSQIFEQDESNNTNTNTNTNDKKKLCCDKCDGKHETSQCPYFKKDREDHPDAQKNAYKKIGGVSNLPGSIFYNARLVRQPGDGSCLFHSMSYGLRDGSNASKLRSELCRFIASNPDCKISDTPLSDWIKWDSSISCTQYARKMNASNSWGGGIEMACTSLIKKCNVHVYEKNMFGYFKRISAFDYVDEPEKRLTIRVVYQGSCHYDALIV